MSASEFPIHARDAKRSARKRKRQLETIKRFQSKQKPDRRPLDPSAFYCVGSAERLGLPSSTSDFSLKLLGWICSECVRAKRHELKRVSLKRIGREVQSEAFRGQLTANSFAHRVKVFKPVLEAVASPPAKIRAGLRGLEQYKAIEMRGATIKPSSKILDVYRELIRFAQTDEGKAALMKRALRDRDRRSKNPTVYGGET